MYTLPESAHGCFFEKWPLGIDIRGDHLRNKTARQKLPGPAPFRTRRLARRGRLCDSVGSLSLQPRLNTTQPTRGNTVHLATSDPDLVVIRIKATMNLPEAMEYQAMAHPPPLWARYPTKSLIAWNFMHRCCIYWSWDCLDLNCIRRSCPYPWRFSYFDLHHCGELNDNTMCTSDKEQPALASSSRDKRTQSSSPTKRLADSNPPNQVHHHIIVLSTKAAQEWLYLSEWKAALKVMNPCTPRLG
ncbi:hypothetical protein CISG_09923 [Coccidioides immitis RMSCC 3703]|uniref:Uncharacterized protein n=2 Tax=Coccidioides immitis TaxID=5501 RepID=A0A0J8QKI7_COCIT|nr:hypothetical protein CIRG_03804 [Coccidioides immitis RMSCC 2394]KMU72959.1 hypothetical protein CISG_09923 [Coccidioides immitis RMSCC 3703]